MKQLVVHNQEGVAYALKWAAHYLAKGLSGGKAVTIRLSHESRSDAQNRKMWPLLTCFAEQREYSGCMRSNDDWKLILLSAYLNDPSGLIIGINGEVINLKLKSSALSKAAFSEFIESIYAQGCEWDIAWSEPAITAYEEWGIK